MAKKTSLSTKKQLRPYRRTILNALCNDFSVALLCAALPAIYKIKSIEAGEYPGQAAEVIQQRLAELRPGIIADAVICFFVVMILLFIPILIYRFRLEHGVNLVQKLKDHFAKNRTKSDRK